MNSYEVGCVMSDLYNLFKKGSSVVSGGYLRDVDLGRQPKDVDVFVEYQDTRDIDEMIIHARAFGYSVKRIGGNYGEIGKDLHSVYALSKGSELKIDVIFLNIPVHNRINEFPCNLCKIYRNPKGEIIKHEDYLDGVKNKVIRYNKDTARVKYVEKMKNYFPDWEHVG